MPVPAAALIGGAASLIGTGINAASTGNQNRKNREFSEKMYDRQKDDSLEFWQMQNTYNSPEQQMARLQKAGLNPNLVYGNGSAANTAGNIDTPHAAPYKGEAPQVDLPQIVDSYFNIQSQQQLISNQKKQADLLDAQTALANANTADKLFETDYSKNTSHIRRAFDAERANKMHYEHSNEVKKYELANALQDIQIEKANQELESLKLGNTLRSKESRFKDLDYQQAKEAYDYSKGGMKLQDWLKLGLGAASEFIPHRRYR